MAGDTARGDTAKQNAAAITGAKAFMEKPLGHPHDEMLTIAKRAVHPIFEYNFRPARRAAGKVIPSRIDPVLVIQAANVATQWHSTQRRNCSSREPRRVPQAWLPIFAEPVP